MWIKRAWVLARSAFFTILIPGTVTYYIPHRSGAFARARAEPWIALAGVPLAAGALLLLYCIFEFAWTGLGTLAIVDPPRNLVVRGPYRYVRNPMYLGVTAILCGEAMAFRGNFLPLYALSFFAAASVFVLVYEEPTLRRKFGQSYVEYCAKVPRWLPRW